jgi:hypothetical protein
MDPIFAQVRRFTDVEVATLPLWLRGVAAGPDFAALTKAQLDAGLYKEHLLSELDHTTANWTLEQAAEFARAEAEAARTAQALLDALGADDQARQDASPLLGSGQGSGAAGSGQAGY